MGPASFEVNTHSGKRLLIDPVFNHSNCPANIAFELVNDFERKASKYSPSPKKPITVVMYSHLHCDQFNKHDANLIGNETHKLGSLGFAAYFDENHYGNGLVYNNIYWLNEYAFYIRTTF
ncbi:hypothetical protein [Pseudoalteromonas sp.]|uniref:hypothetical protein n=1 Tax=Pseudoalteromonas sp. TaxID=53249 RepID=UPI003566800D